VKYGNSPGQTIVGYETYLKRAEAIEQLDGWKCWIDDDDDKAKIIIHRKDRQHPFEWEVDREEFNKGQSTWKVMPNHMLKKVCISLGMRLCFPEHLGGMPYTKEEVGVEEQPKKMESEPKLDPVPPKEEAPPKVDPVALCYDLLEQLTIEDRKVFKKKYPIKFEDMAEDDLREAYRKMDKIIKAYEKGDK